MDRTRMFGGTRAMHIDAHQHFWMYDQREYDWIDDSMAALRRDFLPPALKPELNPNGFPGCVAVHPRQTLKATRTLLKSPMQPPPHLTLQHSLHFPTPPRL